MLVCRLWERENNFEGKTKSRDYYEDDAHFRRSILKSPMITIYFPEGTEGKKGNDIVTQPLRYNYSIRISHINSPKN